MIQQAFKTEAEIIIVTGYSGAGKNTVLRALEDLDFFCVDNLPIALLPSFFDLLTQPRAREQKVALGIDVRGGQNIDDLMNYLKTIDDYKFGKIKICFLTSNLDVLIKRYQETRRKHPLGDNLDLAEAIKKEKELLKPLTLVADLILDTGQLNIHQLRNFVRHSFSDGGDPVMLANLISFGFKYGTPKECNFVYDLRSLSNPYFVDNLRSLTGTDDAVLKYLFEQKDVKEYWKKLIDFFTYTLYKSYHEGRYIVNIGIGCTGGRHRSVAFVRKLSEEKFENVHILVKHRDLNKDLELNKDSEKKDFINTGNVSYEKKKEKEI